MQPVRIDVCVRGKIISSPYNLLDSVSGGEAYDIFLLDILMPDMTGISLGTGGKAAGIIQIHHKGGVCLEEIWVFQNRRKKLVEAGTQIQTF